MKTFVCWIYIKFCFQNFYEETTTLASGSIYSNNYTEKSCSKFPCHVKPRFWGNPFTNKWRNELARGRNVVYSSWILEDTSGACALTSTRTRDVGQRAARPASLHLPSESALHPSPLTMSRRSPRFPLHKQHCVLTRDVSNENKSHTHLYLVIIYLSSLFKFFSTTLLYLLFSKGTSKQ